jgi:hypothetical protein
VENVVEQLGRGVQIENHSFKNISDVSCNGLHVPGNDALVRGIRQVIASETGHTL